MNDDKLSKDGKSESKLESVELRKLFTDAIEELGPDEFNSTFKSMFEDEVINGRPSTVVNMKKFIETIRIKLDEKRGNKNKDLTLS